jgi:hypothetical protein
MHCFHIMEDFKRTLALKLMAHDAAMGILESEGMKNTPEYVYAAGARDTLASLWVELRDAAPTDEKAPRKRIGFSS